MSTVRKMDKDFAHADIAAVTGLLAQLGDNDVLTRLSLEERLEELRERAAELDLVEDQPTASAALFFGGRPVIGARAINSEFGGSAVVKFQDLVAKVMAQDAGRLGQRGIVANRGASTLHITNIVRGSFGFLLEELQEQQQMVESPLKTAVDHATRLLDAFGEPGDEQFQAAVEAVDQRVLGTAREFFDLMRQEGATLRVVAGERDRSFGAEAVARAAERATATTIDDEEVTLKGNLGGVLPDAHQFEFRANDAQTAIRGKVDRAITTAELFGFNRDLVGVQTTASFQVRRVRNNGAIVRESFTLLAIVVAPPA